MTTSACVSLFDVRPDLRPALPGDPVVVPGDLDLAYSAITYLPDPLSIGGDLDLQGTELTHLPKGLSVGGRLNLWGTDIHHLPDGLSIGGDLSLLHAPITCLPQKLSIGGHLFAQTTSITHLPADLCVQGQIFPPYTLVDLVALRSTLTEPLRLDGAQVSAHATAALVRRLAPYPDVWRVWQSFAADRTRTWTIPPMSRAR